MKHAEQIADDLTKSFRKSLYNLEKERENFQMPEQETITAIEEAFYIYSNNLENYIHSEIESRLDKVEDTIEKHSHKEDGTTVKEVDLA